MKIERVFICAAALACAVLFEKNLDVRHFLKRVFELHQFGSDFLTVQSLCQLVFKIDSSDNVKQLISDINIGDLVELLIV